jgi:hypothetical protein
MENLTKKQAENLARALKFYADTFEGYTIKWDMIKPFANSLSFYLMDKNETLILINVPNDKYIPLYISATPKGESEAIYFASKESLLEYFKN